MVRRFFKDSALYGIATILSKGLTVLMVPIYTASLTRVQMGTLELLLGTTSILSLIIGLDISNALSREYGEAGDPAVRRRFSSTSLWFSVAVFGIALAAILGSADRLAAAAGNAETAGAIRAAAAAMSTGGIYLVVLQQLRWMMQPGKFGIVSVSYTVISLSVTLLLSGPLRMGEAGVLYGTAAGSIAGILLSLKFSRGEFSLTFDRDCLKKMLRFCIPLVPSSLAVVGGQYVSRFIIEHVMGREPVGVFAVGTRLAGLAGLVMLGFGSALTPLIYAAQHDPATPGNLARIFRIFTGMASAGLAGLILFTPEILALLTRSDYSAAAPLLAWLAPSFLLMQMYIFAPGAWIKRRMWPVAATNGFTALAAVILNWILVPRMGLQGAAVATLLSGVIHFGLSMAVSQRLYPVPHEWGKLLRTLAGGVAVMILAGFLPQQITPLWFLLKTAIFGLLCILISTAGGVNASALSALRRKA